jgi:hypothetical protein
MSTIITRNSANSGSTPSSLVQGELAINVTDGRLFYGSGSGNVVKEFTGSASGGSTSPGGPNQSVQFNRNGIFSGSNNFTFNSASNALTLTGSLNISGSIFNPNSIHFYTTASGVTQVGQLGWDDGYGTLNLMLKGGNVDVELGQENVVLVFNNSGTTLNKGEIVYVSGSQGNRPSVNRAIATSDGYSVTTLGFAAESITSGAEGYITTFGFINNINTSGSIGGTPVWLSPTVAGGWTTTKPQAPNHTVLLGYIVRVSPTVGSIFVHISNGWEIDELHDVRIISASAGDLIVRSGSLWINTKQLTGSYGLTGSLAQGNTTISSGAYSHAEGYATISSGSYSHAEGDSSVAYGEGSHAEGLSTQTQGEHSHSEGTGTNSIGNYSHAEGNTTISSGSYSHAEGDSTLALGQASHAEGNITQAIGDYSHAEGDNTRAVGNYSHAEGQEAIASGSYSHAEGYDTRAIGDRSHAEGSNTKTGTPTAYSASVSAGLVTLDASYGDISIDFSPGSLLYLYDAPFDAVYSKAIFTISSSTYTTQTEVQLTDVTAATTKAYVGGVNEISFWSGDQTIPGDYSHSEGEVTIAIGDYSHAEGRDTAAIGSRSHAEGFSTKAIGFASHAEGQNTQAWGDYSHAEGDGSQARGQYSHAEGRGTQAIGDYSHTEGRDTVAIGTLSHAEGYGTITSGSYQHAQGQFNTQGNTTSLVIIGNGVDNNNRSDLALFNTDGIQFTQPVTGSVFSGSFTGSLEGTASFAISASWAPASGVNINNNTNNYLLTATGTANTINGESNLTFDGTLLLLTGSFSHGLANTAIGQYSHAEGSATQANGGYSHAEGFKANASGQYSHAEGDTTQAKGFASHAEGNDTIASGSYSHTLGSGSVALGTASYAAGLGTVAKLDYQYIIGKYNSESSALFAIGNGTSALNTSNLALFNSNGIEFTQPLTASIISGSAFTGSLFGTATSASYVNGMITKNNAIANTSFTGTPRKATVTFTTAFPNTNYSVVITGEDLRSWTIESKLAGSFVINTNSNAALTGATYWQATSYGEFRS